MTNPHPSKPAFTPGPWLWRYPSGTTGGPELVAPHSGLLLVMDAVRDGMNGASVRFAERVGNSGGRMKKACEFLPDLSPRRADYQCPQSHDMLLIAAAPSLYAACKAAQAALPGQEPAWKAVTAALTLAERGA